MAKKKATIQLDVDGVWVIYQHFGHAYKEEHDEMYASSIPRFLDLFDEFKIKASLFVVGKDLLIPWRRALVQEAVQRGHEIANHSYSHAEGFSQLSFSEKHYEIMESHRVIQDILKVTPVGFRTPCNDVDEEVVALLKTHGYLYDASLMPTWYGPLVQWLKFYGQKKQKRHYLGRIQYGRAPLSAYYPSEKCIYRKGSGPLYEIPISTAPYVRFPFHPSFLFATIHWGMGTRLFDTGFGMYRRTRHDLHFVFHTNELSDPISAALIERQYGLNLPLSRKWELCRYVLERITREYECVTIKEYVQTMRNEH